MSSVKERITKKCHSDPRVTIDTIHNELIKDKRFVLIGRGIYALDNWGYSKGTVSDIITQVLKDSNEPLHRDEIVKRVLKSRQVKETTILLNLQSKNQFKRVAKATYTLAEDGNRMVKANEGFMVAACINPPNDYAGVRPLNRATKDRFDLQMTIQYLPAAEEAKLIQRLSGNRNRELARNLVSMANDLRELKTQRKLQSDTSTRTLITVMQAAQHMNLTQAIDFTMVNRYQETERRDVQMAARARLAEY